LNAQPSPDAGRGFRNRLHDLFVSRVLVAGHVLALIGAGGDMPANMKMLPAQTLSAGFHAPREL